MRSNFSGTSRRLRLKGLALVAVGIVLDLAPRVEDHELFEDGQIPVIDSRAAHGPRRGIHPGAAH